MVFCHSTDESSVLPLCRSVNGPQWYVSCDLPSILEGTRCHSNTVGSVHGQTGASSDSTSLCAAKRRALSSGPLGNR